MAESTSSRRSSEADPAELIRLATPLREPHLLVAADGRVLAVNPAAVRNLGAVVEDAGRHARLHELVTDASDRVDRFVRSAARSTAAVPGSFTFRMGDGSTQRCGVSGGLVAPAQDGGPAMVLIRLRPHVETVPGFLRLNERIGDLTRALHERRIAQEALAEHARELEALSHALERQRDVAEAANQAKSRFIAAMSHELRTPLNTILGYVELLCLGVSGPVSDEQRRQLGKVTRTTEHLISIINDILRFAREEAEGPDLEMKEVDLVEVVDGATELIGPDFANGAVSLTRSFPPGPVTVTTDPVKVQQIVLNLLSNAAKFTPAGDVCVGLEADGSDVRISVRDTGIGIAEEDQDRVFESFWQAEVGRGGTGLGLALTRQIARRLGGDVHLDSEPGRGSVFTVTLPRRAR